MSVQETTKKKRFALTLWQFCNNSLTNPFPSFQMDISAPVEDGDARKQAVLKDCFGDSEEGGGIGPDGDVSFSPVTVL